MPDSTNHGAQAAAAMRATAEELAAETRRLPAELIYWVPSEGVWSVMDNLCHIREFVPFWTNETLRISRRPGETWGRDHTDTARKGAVTDTARFALEEVLRDISAAVDDSASTLEKLTNEELAVEAESKNPRWGRKPAAFVVEDLLVQHLKKHLGQIRRNAQQYADRENS